MFIQVTRLLDAQEYVLVKQILKKAINPKLMDSKHPEITHDKKRKQFDLFREEN